MSPIPSLHEPQRFAETLIWQARYRAIFLPLIGFAALTLKWFGSISSASLFAPRFGDRALLAAVAAAMLVYLGFHHALAAWVRRTSRAGLHLVVAAIASDVLAILVVIALVTPPQHYERALILALFTVQLTQMFFGWTATLVNIALVAIGYTSLIAVAVDAGSRISPAEELWTLALYLIGALMYVALQGHVMRRMRRLEHLFGRAQDGDFSARFEEEPGQMPDPITMIGRAYNRMRAHLETIVLTDPLSGCFNRRGLNQLAEREVSRAVRGKRHLAVLAIDLDHFKRINDEFGHLTGDEAIREAGALLRETAREPDVVSRIGGEEFVVLAPDTDDEGALILAERVMEAFRKHQFRSLPPETRITVSAGIAAAPARDDEAARVLLAQADEALYIAKRNGRDRAVVWHAGLRAFDGTVGARGRLSTPGMVRTV